MYRLSRTFCLSALALLALLVGEANSQTFNAYDVTGDRRQGDFADGDVEGTVRFEAGGTEFSASLLNAPGAFGGAPGAFIGSYTELNLLLISFWSYEGTALGVGSSASGSGIRLFFGLLVFGTVLADGYTIEFSGGFSGQVSSEADPLTFESHPAWSGERVAESRRYRLAVARR